MRCSICNGKVIKQKINYIQWYKDHPVIIRNVPAEVCTQCGEQLLKPEIVEKLQSVIWECKKPIRKISTPVYAIH